MKRALLFFVLVALTRLAVAAQPSAVTRLNGTAITPADIDATVTGLMSAAEATGVAITILNHRRVVYQKTYGFRDKEKNLPLTVNSVMHAASLTKVAFAYMVMQLVDEKVLNLDGPISKYLRKPENHEMFAEGDRDFFSKTADDEITFAVDDKGQTTEMIFRTGGRTMNFKRVD